MGIDLFKLLDKAVVKSSLRRLHQTHNQIYSKGTFGRNIGKTFYWANVLKGYLDVLEDEQIVVILEDAKRVEEFTKTFFEVIENEGFNPRFRKMNSTIDFENNSNKVLFKYLKSSKNILDELHGTSIRNIVPICDLENLPRDFYTNLSEYSENTLYYLENYTKTFSNYNGIPSTNVVTQIPNNSTFTFL